MWAEVVACPIRFAARGVWLLLAGALIWTFALHYLLKDSVSFVRDALRYGKTKEAHDLHPWLNVPKRYFQHFYLVGALWNLAFLWVGLFWPHFERSAFACPYAAEEGRPWLSLSSVVPYLGLYQLHLSRRLYECYYVSRFSTGGKMHVFQYLFGLVFYLFVPITIASTVDVTIQGGLDATAVLFGTWVFLYGNWKQHRLHVILARLRDSREHKASSSLTMYRLPRGDWFDHISSPHYTAEIVIYIGLMGTLTRFHVDPVWLGMITVIVLNLTFSASATHRWYANKFKGEFTQSNRSVIFPGVY
jgi:3-oxo-5-alpha-steroid 4-dehydrogenase 3 / polyprenol reductase